jgi:hypothetical protein
MNHKGGPKGVPNICKKIVIGQSKWHLQQQPPKNNSLGTPLNKLIRMLKYTPILSFPFKDESSPCKCIQR